MNAARLLFLCPEADRDGPLGTMWCSLLPRLHRGVWTVVEPTAPEREHPEAAPFTTCDAVAFLPNASGAAPPEALRTIQNLRTRLPHAPVFELWRGWMAYESSTDGIPTRVSSPLRTREPA